MIREIICKNCGKVERIHYVCDYCGLEMTIPFISVSDVTNPFYIQGLNKHFCSHKCHMQDTIYEYNKTNKSTDTLYGK